MRIVVGSIFPFPCVTILLTRTGFPDRATAPMGRPHFAAQTLCQHVPTHTPRPPPPKTGSQPVRGAGLVQGCLAMQ